jgi:hypothetical protein
MQGIKDRLNSGVSCKRKLVQADVSEYFRDSKYNTQQLSERQNAIAMANMLLSS